jgi:hypothetical protein
MPIGNVQGSFLGVAPRERLRNRPGEQGQPRLTRYHKVFRNRRLQNLFHFGKRLPSQFLASRGYNLFRPAGTAADLSSRRPHAQLAAKGTGQRSLRNKFTIRFKWFPGLKARLRKAYVAALQWTEPALSRGRAVA